MCPPCHHPGEGRSPPAPGQGEQGGVGGDATVPRSRGFSDAGAGAGRGSLQRGETRVGLQKLLMGFEFLIPIRN